MEKRQRHEVRAPDPLQKYPYRPVFRDELSAILKKNELKRAEPLGNLVRHYTEETFDVYSVVELVHAGLGLVAQKEYRQTGESILRQVEGYLSRDEIITKQLLPPKRVLYGSGLIGELPDDSLHGSFGRMHKEIPALQKTYEARTSQRKDGFVMEASQINHLLQGVRDSVDYPADDASRLLVNIRSPRARQANFMLSTASLMPDLVKIDNRPQLEEEEQQVIRTLERRRKLVETSVRPAAGIGDLMRNPEELLAICFDNNQAMGQFDFAQARYGGVNLVELMRIENAAERAKKTMAYVTSLPKGDLFWRQIVRGIFFNPQFAPVSVNFTNPEWTEAIYESQLATAEMFVNQDTEGLDAIGRMLQVVDEDTIDYYALSLTHAVKFTPFTHTLLHQGATMTGYTEKSKFYMDAIRKYAREVMHVGNDESGVALVDEVMQWYLAASHVEALQALREVMGRSGNFRVFEETYTDLVTQNYKEAHTSYVLDVLSKRLGGESWERLSGISLEELDQVGNEMIQTFCQKQMMGFWPSAEAMHTVTFDGRSLPVMMGLESITFIAPPVDEAAGSTLQFVLHMADPKVAMRGELPVDFLSNSMKLSLDLSGNRGLESVLRAVVISSFHDLVLRNHLQKHVSGASKSEPSASRKRRNRGKGRETGEEIQVPRSGRSVLDEPYKEETFSLLGLQGQIDAGLKITDKTYEARTIDPHPQALRGAKQYQHAVHQYEEQKRILERGTDPQSLLDSYGQAVTEARVAMYNMSQTKRSQLDSLPPTFRGDMRTIVDPLTGEEVYLTTWVTDYLKPKPDAQERSSLVKMYARRYRTGPQTRFLDVLMVKLLGESDSE